MTRLQLLKRGGFCLLLVATLAPAPAFAADAAPALPEAAQWARTIGQSGLRRFYSTGADLGELVNRQVSYQTARRLDSARRAQNPGAPVPDARSDVHGFVAQVDSLAGLDTALPHPFFVRTLARVAKRFEPDKLHSRNDRYDLGVLYAPGPRAYAGLGLGVEQTRVDLKYVSGSTRLDAYGPRVDAGTALRPWLALGLRAEQLHFSGDNTVAARTPSGTLRVTRDLDYRRRYLQLESIVRLTRAQLPSLPAGWQAGGMVGLQYLDTRYRDSVNSLGQAVSEPFGTRERLGVIRTGIFLQGAFGANAAWNPYLEVLMDHEFDTNMAQPLSARNSLLLRSGLARTLGPGKRLSLEYQRSQSSNGTRERDNLILLAVLDF